jgi:hypothetical protein
MKLNRVYRSQADMPATIPLFALAGALLLPRRPIQLTVFEPRYLAMLDDALSAERLIGVVQPLAGDEATERAPALYSVGCAGRVVQYAEMGDGRCFLTLMGLARFRIGAEVTTLTPYRIAQADYSGFGDDFVEAAGEGAVDRDSVIKALKRFAEANDVKIDWGDISKASNEALVNGLSMMSPYGAKEKQALLEAPDLKTRAEILVAVATMAMASAAGAPTQLH